MNPGSLMTPTGAAGPHGSVTAAPDAAKAANPLTVTARALRRHLVTAMGISARMGAEQ